MDEFKKCPKGHVYNCELDECPYCGGKKIEDDLINIPGKPDIDIKILDDIADCYMQISGDIDGDDNEW